MSLPQPSLWGDQRMLQRGTVTRQSHDLNNSAVRLLIVERELQLGIGGFRLC